jgi:hypothetical protein
VIIPTMPVAVMTTEALYDVAAELDNRIEIPSATLTLFQGSHPSHGFVTVVISPLGDGVLMYPAPAVN